MQPSIAVWLTLAKGKGKWFFLLFQRLCDYIWVELRSPLQEGDRHTGASSVKVHQDIQTTKYPEDLGLFSLKSVGEGNLTTVINYLTEMPRSEGTKLFLQMHIDSMRDNGYKLQQIDIRS